MIALALCLAAGLDSRGAAVTSTWSAGSSNWGTPANWTNGVPNNGADTYTAVVNTPGNTLTLNLPVTISTLTFTAGRIFGQNQTLTVLGQTTLGPGADGSNFNSPVPAATVYARATGTSGTSSSTIDLGTLTNFSGGTISQGGFTAEMLNPATDTGTATIRWQGAAIATIAAPALISLTGGGASIRNSVDNSDALTGLNQINGELRLARRGITVTGPLTNAGQLSINSIQLLGGTTDPLDFQTGGAFTNNGTFTDNSNSPNTTFQIGGAWTNAGTANLSFTNYGASPATLAASIGGDLVNSGTFALRSGAGFGAAAQNATFSVAGNLSNSGSFSLTGGAGALAMDFSGSLTGLVGGVLTGTWTLDASQAGSTVLLAINNAPVTSIAAGASVRILGGGAEFRNKTTSSSALANLSQVLGTLELSGQNLAVNGNFANSGTVIFSADATSGSKTFAISGNLANAGGGVLGAGNYQIRAVGAGVTAVFSWNGTGITSIGANASVELNGAGASFQAGGVDALGGLSSVSGYLRMIGRTLAITGNFSNSGKIVNYVDAGVALEDTNWTVTGNLANLGDFSVAGATQAAQVAVGGTLSNAGTLTITGTGSSPTGYAASVVAQGALVQQVGTTLTAGDYELDAGSNGTATLAWQGADVRTIGVGVTVSLSGTGASLKNSANNANALVNLTANNGKFTLDNGSLTTLGALSNAGDLEVTSNRADSSLTVGGGLVNTGTLTVLGGESGAGKQTVLTVNGSFDNSGTISVLGKSSAEFRPSGHALVNIQGVLAQQSGTTLTGGTYEVLTTHSTNADQPTAVLAWQGAHIQTIGKNASVVITGAGSSIRNLSDGTDALTGLASVAGNFETHTHSFTTAGNLDVSGNLYVEDGDFHVSGSLTNSGITQIDASVFGGTRTFQVDGAFSNSGEIDVVAYGTFNAATSRVVSTSALAQNSGGGLNAGRIAVYAIGSQGVAEAKWAGAQIDRIAAGASLTIQGAGAAIRDSGTQADALSGLSENAGELYIGDRTQVLAGNFTNTGSLVLYNGAKIQMSSGTTLSSTGSLDVGRTTALLTGNLVLGAGGNFEVFDDYNSQISQSVLGSLQAGSVLLDGKLQVTLYDLIPSAAATYVIIDGTALTGSFSNVAFGQRVAVDNGNIEGAVSGSFQVNLDVANQNVTLSNYLPVPEPGAAGLLAVAAVVLWWRSRRHA
ncbi:MAG: hypothetical protein PHC88_11715 [Terrimicrobiaceae bacterium]|nr:hypothetical protein [Terrimicrobiaceae bacterium]